MPMAVHAPTPEQILAQFHREIEATPEVCGGDARIAQTRIPVWLLEECRRLGMTEAQILADYPSLTASDLVSVWAYASAHPSEIDEQIASNEEA